MQDFHDSEDLHPGLTAFAERVYLLLSLVAKSARATFTAGDYGRVSDHEGYLVAFELG